MNPLCFHAGPKALAHLQQHGLRAQDVAIIPAAAGGPKGLILQALDQWLFGHWLPGAPRERTLIGASIGAWRMAAACHSDPIAAFQRLGDLYCEQRYPHKPSPRHVADICTTMLKDFIGGRETEITTHPLHRLHVLTVRGRRLLNKPRGTIATAAGFAAAALANLGSRNQLGNYLERIVIGDMRDPVFWLKAKFDAFNTHFIPLSATNVATALLASGTLPVVMPPVAAIPQAPAAARARSRVWRRAWHWSRQAPRRRTPTPCKPGGERLRSNDSGDS